jgi:hypothetical protein
MGRAHARIAKIELTSSPCFGTPIPQPSAHSCMAFFELLQRDIFWQAGRPLLKVDGASFPRRPSFNSAAFGLVHSV